MRYTLCVTLYVLHFMCYTLWVDRREGRVGPKWAPKWVPTYNRTHAATHANNRKTKTEGYDYMFLFDAHYKRATRSNTNITDNTASHCACIYYPYAKSTYKKQLCNITNATFQTQFYKCNFTMLCNFTYATLQM